MSLQSDISAYIEDTIQHRNRILDDFGRAYLAGVVPDPLLNVEWIMNHIEFVEEKSPDGFQTRWFFRVKEMKKE